GLNIMMSMKGDGKPISFIEDCAVPLEHLAEYTDRLTRVFERHGTRGTWYAHASVGTLHVRPILDMRRDGAAKMRAIAEEACAMVKQYKGAYSGEHGDGLVRSEWIAPVFGPRLTAAPRAVGPARRRGRRGGQGGARSVRLVQGLQARMPDRRGHGAHEDRVSRPLQREPRPQCARSGDRVPAALRAARGAHGATRESRHRAAQAPIALRAPSVAALASRLLPCYGRGRRRRRALRRHL